MASGLPVVTGPFDVLGSAKAAFVVENLSKAVDQAITQTTLKNTVGTLAYRPVLANLVSTRFECTRLISGFFVIPT